MNDALPRVHGYPAEIDLGQHDEDLAEEDVVHAEEAVHTIGQATHPSRRLPLSLTPI